MYAGGDDHTPTYLALPFKQSSVTEFRAGVRLVTYFVHHVPNTQTQPLERTREHPQAHTQVHSSEGTEQITRNAQSHRSTHSDIVRWGSQLYRHRKIAHTYSCIHTQSISCCHKTIWHARPHTGASAALVLAATRSLRPACLVFVSLPDSPAVFFFRLHMQRK